MRKIKPSEETKKIIAENYYTTPLYKLAEKLKINSRTITVIADEMNLREETNTSLNVCNGKFFNVDELDCWITGLKTKK
jgi:hypothetical protein